MHMMMKVQVPIGKISRVKGPLGLIGVEVKID